MKRGLYIVGILFILFAALNHQGESISLADRIREHRLNATTPQSDTGLIYDIPCFGKKWVDSVPMDNHLFTYLSLLVRPLCRRYTQLCTRTPEGEEERTLILNHIAKYNGVDLNLALLIADRFDEIDAHSSHAVGLTPAPEDEDLHYDEEVFRIALIYNHLTRQEARFIREFLEKERRTEDAQRSRTTGSSTSSPATPGGASVAHTVSTTTARPDIPSRHLLLHARRTDVDPKCIAGAFHGIFLRVYEKDTRSVSEKRAALRDYMNFVIESQVKELIDKLRETANFIEDNYDNIVDNRTHVCDNFMKEYGVYPITMLDSMIDLVTVLSAMIEQDVPRDSNIVPTPALPAIISPPAAASDASSPPSAAPTPTS